MTGSDQGIKLTRRIALVALSGGHCPAHTTPTECGDFSPTNYINFVSRILQAYSPNLARMQTHSLQINHRGLLTGKHARDVASENITPISCILCTPY